MEQQANSPAILLLLPGQYLSQLAAAQTLTSFGSCQNKADIMECVSPTLGLDKYFNFTPEIITNINRHIVCHGVQHHYVLSTHC